MHFFYDFKGFKEASINLFERVTLLIGKNGSGKTNAIEGVELLANLAQGKALYEITDIGRGSNTYEIRGGLPSCARSGSDSFALAFSGLIEFGGAHKRFKYTIRIKIEPEPRISKESLQIGSRTIFSATKRTDTKSDILRTRYDNFSRGGNKPSISLSSDRSVLSRYENFTAELRSKGAVYKDACSVVYSLRRYLRLSFVFDPNPKSMRAYERIGQRVLTRDGSNLSSVLYSLHEGNDDDKASLLRILNRIKQLPEEPFEHFEFVTTTQQDVLFGVRETSEGEVMDARILSDGTLRSLAVLTALETVEIGSRIVIEEFDNGLHPSRANIITEALWETSKRRKLNVLVTTHNPATLDTLNDDQLKSVTLCYFDKQSGVAKLTPLMEIPKFDVLLERGHLGDLVTKHLLETHLMPNFETEQTEKALSWLDSLK